MSERPKKAKRQPKPNGRPSLYTPALAEEITERLSNGEPLAVICRDKHMPCDDTVRNWAKGNEELSRAIARARSTGFDVIAWRARQTLRGKGPEGGGESTGDVQRDKAIADFDLKLLAKWDPKGYGDRVDHTSSDGSMSPKPTVIEFVAPSLSGDEGED